jgi:hypothetical protein
MSRLHLTVVVAQRAVAARDLAISVIARSARTTDSVAIANSLDGMSRAEAAHQAGMERQAAGAA